MFYLATKTLDAIDEALEKDGGALFRYYQSLVLPHIDDAYSTDKFPFRSHMGASGLGRECGRSIWYDWRWSTLEKVPARMIRLFNRGHLEEGRLIALLLMIGVEVVQQKEDGKQYKIGFGNGHGGGSGDGFGYNVPDVQGGQVVLTEFKTANKNQFTKLQKEGVKECKPIYYAQAQIYMDKFGLANCLHMTACKDNDDIHAEIIPNDGFTGKQFISKGEELIQMFEPPEKAYKSAANWNCKSCKHRDTCHYDVEPHRNCRTCFYSKPIENGQWICQLNGDNRILSKEEQFKGCSGYKRGF